MLSIQQLQKENQQKFIQTRVQELTFCFLWQRTNLTTKFQRTELGKIEYYFSLFINVQTEDEFQNIVGEKSLVLLEEIKKSLASNQPDNFQSRHANLVNTLKNYMTDKAARNYLNQLCLYLYKSLPVLRSLIVNYTDNVSKPYNIQYQHNFIPLKTHLNNILKVRNDIIDIVQSNLNLSSGLSPVINSSQLYQLMELAILNKFSKKTLLDLRLVNKNWNKAVTETINATPLEFDFMIVKFKGRFYIEADNVYRNTIDKNKAFLPKNRTDFTMFFSIVGILTGLSWSCGHGLAFGIIGTKAANMLLQTCDNYLKKIALDNRAKFINTSLNKFTIFTKDEISREYLTTKDYKALNWNPRK